ncbi:hypothetical protein GGD40_001945 [Paraburkholderia bryophila]|uniref:Uncharacterized protein n=1 Tax=Paraburkholderia bryophila TaxID=420952 RepID=A0A7Y9WKE9_9BURK|nr:hypothetical protein [Paraburkholderia bryophila]
MIHISGNRSRPQRSRSRSRSSNGRIINIDSGPIANTVRRAVFPKELSFGVFFSYQR